VVGHPQWVTNLIGVAARDIHTYTDLAGDSLAVIGTDRKLYTYYDNNFYDITPLSTTIPAVFYIHISFNHCKRYLQHLMVQSLETLLHFQEYTGVNVVNITSSNMAQEFEIQTD
jgi:hypothetical protein